ncbi:hypothetical protein [Cryobacterium sp. Y11]|jgi:hypothetical protein|nr:hypothetical protein [Cryobacterium sp. Y11]
MTKTAPITLAMVANDGARFGALPRFRASAGLAAASLATAVAFVD